LLEGGAILAERYLKRRFEARREKRWEMWNERRG
jgi:hypothetical protein